MKKIGMFLVFCLLIGSQLVRADDVKVKLNSADGSTSFQVRDSADVVVSSITSDGVASFATVDTTHTITAGSDIRVKGNDIFFGDSQTDRKIYDDAANYSTRFSSNAIINGKIYLGNQTTEYIYDNTTNQGGIGFSTHTYANGYTISKNAGVAVVPL